MLSGLFLHACAIHVGSIVLASVHVCEHSWHVSPCKDKQSKGGCTVLICSFRIMPQLMTMLESIATGDTSSGSSSSKGVLV